VKKRQTLADEILELIGNQPVWSILFYTIFFLGSTLAASRMRPFWYDELATYYICMLSDWNTVRTALAAGADLNPPTFYAVTRFSQAIFGTSEVATRLPATLGFLLMLICLHRFIARRTGYAIAFASICFPLVTGAHAWAYEARPYGLMLGLVAVAMLFWQRAGSVPSPHPADCIGLLISLTLAVTTQAYAVLAIGPFILSEVVRYILVREARWTIWLALIAPFSALGFYIPLFANHNTVVLNNAMFRPELASIASFFHMLLNPTLFPLLLVLIFLVWTKTQPGQPTPETPSTPIPAEELTLAFGFLLVPVAAIIVAVGITHIYFDRYGLPAVLGATLCVAYLLARVGNRRVPIVASAVFLFWFLLNAIPFTIFHQVMTTPAGPQPAKIENIRPDLQVVVSSGLDFLTYAHYSEPRLRQRMNYLVDPKLAVGYTGANAFDVAYPIMKKWLNLPGSVESYEQFMARSKPFLLLGPSFHPLDWLTKKLIDDGATVKIVYLHPNMIVCEVTPAVRPK